MSERTIYVCDGCATRVDTDATDGWIRVEGSIRRWTGKWSNGEESAKLDPGHHHFCSLACFSAALDLALEKQRRRKAMAP
jgi:hypothetical protein